MKNLKYFPFERNRYFYGKLLTVDDFEAEQKYMNDKRRLINRFLYGCGVVSGMNVVRVDDTTISVEMGLALDFSGREIVIDTPVIKKLGIIEGFEEYRESGEDSGYMYLCLDYAETGKDPVHSIAGSGVRSADSVEFNKYAEEYRLYLTTREPDKEGFTTEHLYRDSRTIYWGRGIRIRQILPKYVKTGKDTELIISVENMGQQQPFAFSYDLDLTCLEHNGASHIHVAFDERDYEKSGRYQFSIPLKVMNVKDTEGCVSLSGDQLHISISGRSVSEHAECINTCRIAPENEKQQIMEQYYRSEMEEIVKNTYQQSIYLAKIRLIQAGTTYVIEAVENMPFRQYVFNQSLAAAFHSISMKEIDRLRDAKLLSAENGENSKNAYESGGISTASGSVILDLVIGGVEGQKFFSEEISHGLGLGPVSVVLGQAVSLSDDSVRIFGDAWVFAEEGSNEPIAASVAAKVDVTKGTFVIGVQLNEMTSAKKLRIEWMAVRDLNDGIRKSTEKSLMIKPDAADLQLRETCYFQAVFSNAGDKRVRWSVREEAGGSIDKNGMYTAPNEEGVYEIIAESVADPSLKASTFVVVRETGTAPGGVKL